MNINLKSFILLIILLFSFNKVLFAEKIGKINVGLLTALHPKMATFDFFRIGFYKIPLGLSELEKTKKLKEYFLTEEDEKRINAEIKILNEKIGIISSNIEKIVSHEGISNPSFMSDESKKIYEQEANNLYELQMKKLNYEYYMEYPQYTTPKETSKILSEIEKEVKEAIDLIAEKEQFDCILNSSLPVSFNYPFKYRLEAKYNQGPAGINQAMYYAVLSTPKFDRYTKYGLDIAVKDWLSMISRPEAQDFLPVKPWPLVMKGGIDIFPETLKIIYENNNISSGTYGIVLDALKQLNMVETNEK